MSEIIIRAGRILSSITLTVKGLNQAILRARIASWIFRFGALVAGCDIELDAE